jgi:hypothetical protein
VLLNIDVAFWLLFLPIVFVLLIIIFIYFSSSSCSYFMCVVSLFFLIPIPPFPMSSLSNGFVVCYNLIATQALDFCQTIALALIIFWTYNVNPRLHL